ncbi:MAG: hypothetical protein JW772_02630 [Candidatus Diapherotrites archaeon]|nr:hypothetical protein [Candidatus Diapherotrites archaeon]
MSEANSLEKLTEMQIKQMTEKNCLPKTQQEVLLHLAEEVGELCQAARKKDDSEINEEIADVLWQLNKICWMRKISLEKLFLQKLEKNENRDQ